MSRSLKDPEGERRSVRHRAEMGQAHSRHNRGKNARRGLPGKRMPGSNGSWPAAGAAPKPPAICNLLEDVSEGLMPEPVFGQYPNGLLERLLPWLRCERHELLHICSGSLPPGEGIRVDIRPEARPDIVADGRALPLADGSVAAALIDPPYTRQYAADLYGVDYPRPSHLLREASRVVRPCGRIGLIHYIVPMPPPRARLVKVLGLSTGMGFAMRAVTIWEREQEGLF